MAHHYFGHHSTNNHHIELQAQPSSSSTTPPDLASPSPRSTSTTSPSSNTSLINASHYQILMADNVDRLTHLISSSNPDFLSQLVWEPDNSTVLHITASAGQLDHVTLIVQHCPELLESPNSEDDLPVHVAARAGQQAAVEKLIDLADNNVVISMLGRENKDKNTALHIALENQQMKLGMYLFKKCPHSFYHLNEQGISPLYLAIKSGFWDLVKEMLGARDGDAGDPEAQLCRVDGRSVIHATIMAKRTDILEMMLEEYFDLILRTDEKGRRPLSYAAYTGFLDGVKYMLSVPKFQNQAFKPDEDGSFPIHMACIGGNIQVVKEMFSCLPKKMSWSLNTNKQNILHVASYSGKAEIVKYILEQSELKWMINMKDKDGNTPLHLATLGKRPQVVYLLTWDERVRLNLQNTEGSTALDIAEDFGDVPSLEERLTWLALRHAGVRRAPQLHSQNTNTIITTPISDDQVMLNSPGGVLLKDNYIPTTMVMATQDRNHPKKHKNKFKDRLNPLLVVSTLVATVTFASGFTVPGGYNNSNPNQGMATLAHKLAFQVFVISIVIAVNSSVLAVVALIWGHLNDVKLVLFSLDIALPLLGVALAFMSVALMAGLYVVLPAGAGLLWLGIVVLVMGGLFLGGLLVLFIPLCSPTCCIKYRILRYAFHVPFKLTLLACDKGKTLTLY